MAGFRYWFPCADTCVTLLNLFEPQFPHLKTGNNSTHLTGFFVNIEKLCGYIYIYLVATIFKNTYKLNTIKYMVLCQQFTVRTMEREKFNSRGRI